MAYIVTYRPEREQLPRIGARYFDLDSTGINSVKLEAGQNIVSARAYKWFQEQSKTSLVYEFTERAIVLEETEDPVQVDPEPVVTMLVDLPEVGEDDIVKSPVKRVSKKPAS